MLVLFFIFHLCQTTNFLVTEVSATLTDKPGTEHKHELFPF